MSLKDIDTFLQHFVQKCIQVIVQSRLGGTERTHTKCNPDGKDWFNLDIQDLKDIVDQTAKCLKSIQSSQSLNQSLYFLKNNWNVCCEISLRNSDGVSLVLEYWILSSHQLADKQVPEPPKLAPHVYQTLTRMSVMLKSLISLSRATPAYKIASKGQSAESYVICYRVYQCDEDFLSEILSPPNNQQQQQQQQQQLNNQFTSTKSLGSIKTVCSELSLSLVYRTSMNLSPETGDIFKNSSANMNECNALLPLKDDHFKSVVFTRHDDEDILKPLNPAFADTKAREEFDLIGETPFSLLLSIGDDIDSIFDDKLASSDSDKPGSGGGGGGLGYTKSRPISIPKCDSPRAAKSPQIYSTSNDSFVFVEIKPPFAVDDRQINSFFNGPSPTFANSEEDFNDINELATQLAEFDSNISQIDSFVESICLNDSDEIKTDT